MENDSESRAPRWENEAPEETRIRRVRRSAPANGRVLPGMPLELGEEELSEEDSEETRPDPDDKRGAWWHPTGSLGRTALALAATTALALASVGVFLTFHFLREDQRFRVASANNIETSALTEVSRDTLLPVFDEDMGKNIFRVPLADRKAQLERIPWVERATVTRVLPDHIHVEIVERHPVAFAQQGGELGLVDASGVLLTMPAARMAQRNYSFPVVTGLNAADAPEARHLRMNVYVQLMAELDGKGHKLSDQISEVDLRDPDDARVVMIEQGGDVMAHFGKEHFYDRYQRYKENIAGWRQQYPKLVAVDLRYEQQAVLETDPNRTIEPAAPQTATAEAPDASAATAQAAAKPAAKPGKNAAEKETVASHKASEPKAKLTKAALTTRKTTRNKKAAKAAAKTRESKKAQAKNTHAAKEQTTDKERARRLAARDAALKMYQHKSTVARPAVPPVVGQ